MSHLLKSRSRNSAFTLVELLIVIAIIGILASLATVGVMTALEKGKSVAARTEISQLESAIAAAKQNFGGVDNLPSAIKLHSRADSLMADNTQIAINTKNFLTKAFGKAWIPLPNPTTLIYSSTPYMYWMGAGYTGTYPVTLTGMEALVFWLGGGRDGSGTFQGFSSNPAAPWGTGNASYKIKGPFYEFDAVRVLPINIDPLTGKISNLPPPSSVTVSTFVDRWNGSYAYFSSADYSNFSRTVNGGYGAYSATGGSISPLLRATNTFYNPKTFQIISAGPDQIFGKGSFGGGTTFGLIHTPGSGDYLVGAPGYDDLANFSSTQLGKKDE